MRVRKKPNLAVRMEKCAHLLITSPESLRGRWLLEFQYNELCIDLGCGKGRFAVEMAKAAPGALFVALEKSADVMIIALERADAEGLRNIRFVNAFADNITDYFAEDEVSRLYINFCDPWPTNRHAKRRLTHRRFLELYKQTLRPGGEISFKTDNLPLFDFSLREFEACGLNLSEVSRDPRSDSLDGVMTDYEVKFRSQGLPIFQCIASYSGHDQGSGVIS